MWHKQSFTQFWSQSDAYSRRSSLKLTYIHHPLVVCTHQICCAVAVPIALSQDRLLHGHNRLVNWTPCSRMRESKLKINKTSKFEILQETLHTTHLLRLLDEMYKYKMDPTQTVGATEWTRDDGQMDGWMDWWTDGVKPIYPHPPPTTSLCEGYKK